MQQPTERLTEIHTPACCSTHLFLHPLGDRTCDLELLWIQQKFAILASFNLDLPQPNVNGFKLQTPLYLHGWLVVPGHIQTLTQALLLPL